jgi:hypothetical protein
MEGVGFTSFVRGLRNELPMAIGTSGRRAMREDNLKALLVMRFSSQSIAAVYHSLGRSSEGRPLVRQAT